MVEEMRVVTFNDGRLIIENVPHKKTVTPTLDGDFVEYSMRGSVSLVLSAIAEYMEEKELDKFDYKEYREFAEILAIVTSHK